MSMQFVTPARRPTSTPRAWSRTASPGSADVELESFELDGSRLSFSRDDEIFGEGEPADYVYQLVSGAVRTYRLLSDGRRQIEAFHIAGDIFGLEAGIERRTTAEAITGAVVKAVKRSTLTGRAQEDGNMARALWRMTARELKRTQDHIMTLGRRSAAERLAGFLLELADEADTPDEVTLPMSRQDIADYLGLTIETVSRTFTQLQGSGYVAIPSSRRIVLCDRERLAELCE